MSPKISNPLTIIAVFSGLAEAFATVALIQTPPEIQNIFVFFVMFFPTLLVLLFFGVLIFKNEALYAPGDFENQEHYLEVNQIREVISSDIVKDLSSTNNDDIKFTEQQIEYVKNRINDSIEKSDPVSRRNQIEEFLSDRVATVSEISFELGINRSYTYRLLGNLQAQNRVESKTQSGTREIKWTRPH